MPQSTPPRDPLFLAMLIGVVILAGIAIIAATLVTIFAPAQSSSINTWLLSVMSAVGSLMFCYSTSKQEDIKRQLNGRMTEVFTRLDQGKADQRTIGQLEGQAESLHADGRQDDRDRRETREVGREAREVGREAREENREAREVGQEARDFAQHIRDEGPPP